ncbi:hypothetical protein JANAI62_37190 [Jannaschia pagri]|uniref:YgjV family protein n=1 Tax=Jannaschia pagri TaxID=2829797 RepID=A0ABQ4NRW9_9RHOB|nr:hypothetical protein JANAI61_36950 [Jannaschia sp. AI_61]GIT97096.1 hypothetical protein JANAI62_37190 [Jannaschia sp. AI_62]
MPKFVTAMLLMMIAFSVGMIRRKAAILARHTIAVAMLNLFYLAHKAMLFWRILHPRQMVSLLSIQLTRYVACAL